MSPKESQQSTNGAQTLKGPHPSFIQLAKPYVFEQALQQCMTDTGATEAKEDTIRLQGVTWIDSVRKALQLPVRTYNTACVYYHKFRLLHPDNEYDYRDAAAAALFSACKIEDTLKKSRDILCAAYNLRLSAADRLSSDDPLFEAHSKTILGLERLMLEASGFDFRNRYPQKMLMKLVKSCGLDRNTAGMTAYKICLDMYRTFAPLKQTTQTMALACLELAIRLGDIDLSTVTTEYGFDYERWATTREEIMETMTDALDLYTHHRLATLIGPEYPLDKFIAIRIELNREATESRIPRYTEWHEPKPEDKPAANGKASNGTSDKSTTISPQSPASRAAAGEKGKEGTFRFMIDPGRAREEKATVKEFFAPPREVEEWKWTTVDDNDHTTPEFDFSDVFCHVGSNNKPGSTSKESESDSSSLEHVDLNTKPASTSKESEPDSSSLADVSSVQPSLFTLRAIEARHKIQIEEPKRNIAEGKPGLPLSQSRSSDVCQEDEVEYEEGEYEEGEYEEGECEPTVKFDGAARADISNQLGDTDSSHPQRSNKYIERRRRHRKKWNAKRRQKRYDESQYRPQYLPSPTQSRKAQDSQDDSDVSEEKPGGYLLRQIDEYRPSHGPLKQRDEYRPSFGLLSPSLPAARGPEFRVRCTGEDEHAWQKRSGVQEDGYGHDSRIKTQWDGHEPRVRSAESATQTHRR